MAECRVSDRLPATRVGKVPARGWGVAFWGHLRNPSAQLPPRVVTFGALSVAFSKSHKKVAIRISYKFVEGGLHTPNEGDFGVRPPTKTAKQNVRRSAATRASLRETVQSHRTSVSARAGKVSLRSISRSSLFVMSLLFPCGHAASRSSPASIKRRTPRRGQHNGPR
jgi:hypothetical protein